VSSTLGVARCGRSAGCVLCALWAVSVAVVSGGGGGVGWGGWVGGGGGGGGGWGGVGGGGGAVGVSISSPPSLTLTRALIDFRRTGRPAGHPLLAHAHPPLLPPSLRHRRRRSSGLLFRGAQAARCSSGQHGGWLRAARPCDGGGRGGVQAGSPVGERRRVAQEQHRGRRRTPPTTIAGRGGLVVME